MWDRYKPAFVFLLVGFLLYLCYVLRREILLIYVAVLVAVLLTPIVEWICRLRIRRWRPSRGAGAVILAGILLGMVVLFGTVAAPPILRDTRQLQKEWPAGGHS